MAGHGCLPCPFIGIMPAQGLQPLPLVHVPALHAWQTPSFERIAPFEKHRLP